MPENEERIEEQEAATLAGLLVGMGNALMEDNISREEAASHVVDALGREPHVVKREGQLRSQGRMSFGRQREGQEGVALWVPEEGQADD
jgi:hypothetical protein